MDVPVKILVVDDSEYMRTAIRSSIALHSDWIVCGEAQNGKIAIAMARTLKPHLVILDLSMPEMNGLDAASGISAIFPGIPMVMLTMHNSRMLLEKAHRVGITHVFSKQDGLGDHEFEAMRAMLPA